MGVGHDERLLPRHAGAPRPAIVEGDDEVPLRCEPLSEAAGGSEGGFGGSMALDQDDDIVLGARAGGLLQRRAARACVGGQKVRGAEPAARCAE